MSFREAVATAIIGGMFGLGGVMAATHEPPLEIVVVVGGVGLTSGLAVRIAAGGPDDGPHDGLGLATA